MRIATAAFILLGLASAPVDGQETTRTRATITIGEVLSLKVQAGGGAAVLSADGTFRELEGAATLRILANRAWDLHVVSDGSGARVAALEGVGEPESALWWRADTGAGEGFQRAEALPVLVTSGGPGRAEIEVDYRWFDGPGRELQPGTTLHFTLSPR